MAFTYTVNELIESIKVRCLVPISQITFSNTDILRFANEEIELKMIPDILRVKEEYYVTNELTDITSGQSRYPIPYRAIGSRLRLLTYITGENKYPLTRIQPELIPYFQFGTTNIEGASFYVENNDVVIITKATPTTGQLDFAFYLKPNKLVAETRVGLITSIDRVGDGTNGSVTVSNSTFPSNFTTNSLIDFLQAKPGFRTYDYDVTVTNVNPTTKQVFMALSDIPDNLVVGDHVATAGECMTPQVPAELQSMLAQTVACRLLESMGDVNNLKVALVKLSEMEKNLFSIIDNRTEGNPQKINNVNGLMARSRVGYRRYGGYKP